MREKMIFLLSVILEINRVNIEVEAIYIYIYHYLKLFYFTLGIRDKVNFRQSPKDH